MINNYIAFYQFCSAVRRKGALALCLALCTLGLGLCASTYEPRPSIITFDAPGADTVITWPTGITPTGTIVGFYINASGVWHGFLPAPSGDITTLDAPGAGSGAGQGTAALGINPAGTIVGNSTDASTVLDGFLRAPDGRFTTFDVPGAQGTAAGSINPAGEIEGYYGDASGVYHGFLRTP